MSFGKQTLLSAKQRVFLASKFWGFEGLSSSKWHKKLQLIIYKPPSLSSCEDNRLMLMWTKPLFIILKISRSAIIHAWHVAKLTAIWCRIRWYIFLPLGCKTVRNAQSQWPTEVSKCSDYSGWPGKRVSTGDKLNRFVSLKHGQGKIWAPSSVSQLLLRSDVAKTWDLPLTFIWPRS